MSDRAAPRPGPSWFVPLVAALLVLAGCGSPGEDSSRSTGGDPAAEESGAAAGPGDSSSDAPIDTPEALVIEFFKAVEARDVDRFTELTSSIDRRMAADSRASEPEEIMTMLAENVSDVTPTGVGQYDSESIDGLPASVVDVTVTFQGKSVSDEVVVVEEPDGALRVVVNYIFLKTIFA